MDYYRTLHAIQGANKTAYEITKVKTASIILFITLLFTSVFYCVSLNVTLIEARLDARKKISKQISDQDLTLIKIPSKDSKLIDGREIWYNDKLYDIASTEISGDTTYYYALEDRKEQETLSQIYEHFNTEGNSLNSQTFKLTTHKRSVKGIYQLYCFDINEYKHHRDFSFLDYIDLNTSSMLGIHKVLTPPPKNISISNSTI